MISDFSRSDLMLGGRGFLGASLAMSAGPALVEPMQRWLVPAHLASAAPPAHAPVAGGVDHGRRGPVLSEPELELLEQTAAMFRRWDAQCGGGLRRKAVVGQLHEVTELLQDSHPERPSPAGCSG